MAATLQLAVRLPSPQPNDPPRESQSARKRSPVSRSPSPRRPAPSLRRRSPSPGPSRANGKALPRDVDRARAMERARQMEMRQKDEAAAEDKPLTAEEKQAAAKAEYDKLVNMRSGGTYIPPARLRALQAQITDKSSKEYQRMAWEALKKSINGLINKVNVSNIKHIVPELFNENLVRGRGLFCRSIMKAQAASLPFTPIYAAMAAIVNTKLPQVGELLSNRLILQFRKAYKRNDKSVCLSSSTFLAHLINQQVVHEMLAAQMLLLLLNKPTDDSVEIAVGLMREVGAHIDEMNSQIANAVFDQFRSILNEADIDKRTQYMIEVLFQIRKDKYKDQPAIKEELDLVEESDQITHRPGLDENFTSEDGLNIFKFDPDWEANEEAYAKLKAEILGEASESDEEDGDEASEESSDEEDEAEKALEIKDQSNTDLVNLRRSIYLTIMSSGGFEEACHKLMRIDLPQGREDELPSMIIECCSQERTYNKFFGLIGERFCKLNRLWKDLFENMFAKYYDTIHRYETNRLRIIAQFFGHLLASDAIGWEVFNVIKLNEEDTTSSSRIFIKILIEDLAQGLGMKGLTERFKHDELQFALAGMFPTDNPKNTRFSINFFTAIGMGVLTEGMREWLKNMPKPEPAKLPAPKSPSPGSRSESVSSYSSYSSYSSRSDSRSRSPPRPSARGRERSYSRSPPRKSRAISRSRSPRRGRDRSSSYDSRSPPPKRSRRYSDSLSRSPPRRATNGRRRSYSDSPPLRSTRGRSYTRSASPPRRNGKAPMRDRSPPRRRDRSYSSSISRSRSPARRSRARSISRSISRSPPRGSTYAASRRKTTSSPESSRSRSPPPAKKASRALEPVKPTSNTDPEEAPKEIEKAVQEEDESHIHPSRRGMVPRGGKPGRAKASDFIDCTFPLRGCGEGSAQALRVFKISTALRNLGAQTNRSRYRIAALLAGSFIAIIILWSIRGRQLPQFNILDGKVYLPGLLKSDFVGQSLDSHLIQPYNATPLANLCRSRPPRPQNDIIIKCAPGTGGIGNISSYVLHCVRFALEAGAPLVLPHFHRRHTENLFLLDGVVAEFEHFFDKDVFKDMIETACPHIKVFDRIDEIGWTQSGLGIPYFGGKINESSLERPNEWRQQFDAWLEVNTKDIERPFVIESSDPGRGRAVLDDGWDFYFQYGRILQLRPDIRRLAAKAMSNMNDRFKLDMDPTDAMHKGAYFGAHLRTNQDAIDAGWNPDFEAQTDHYLAQAAAMNLSVIYAAAGNDADLRKFEEKAAGRDVVVVHKYDLLDDDDLQNLQELSWDQRGLMDFQILMRAGGFGGYSRSSFSHNVALRRHFWSEMWPWDQARSPFEVSEEDRFVDEWSRMYGTFDRGWEEESIWTMWP